MTNEFADDNQTGDQTTVVSIGTEAGLIASVPALLGFAPQESLVVLSQHQHASRGRLGPVLRTDLPTSDDAQQALLEVVPARLANAGADTVHLMIVTEHDTASGVPAQAGLVDALQDAFAAVGIAASSAFWTPTITRGAPWRCYGRCQCAGVLPDPGATELAAHQAVLGKVTYRSRQEAEAALAPEPASCSARRRQMLDSAHDRAESARNLDWARAVRDDVDAVRAAAAEVGAGQRLDESTLARVVVALRDPAVRDVCLGFVLGNSSAVRPEHAEQLWWALTRGAPRPEVAEPATLLAFTALLRGGGAQVSVALERAHDADPDHRLSRLLAAMIDRAVEPAAVRRIAIAAADEATARLVG